MPKLTQDRRPDLHNVMEASKPKELGLIPAWSHSTLKTYETCPYRIYISKVKRISEDYGPAAKRGSVIHEEAEHYVEGTLAEFPDSLKKFTTQFEHLRNMYDEGKVELEGEWGFTIDWEPCGWMAPNVWARVKLDAMVHEDKTSARVIDYKTGKQFGNEITHGQQALTYAIGTFLRYPDLQHVQTELWYLDHGTTMEQSYTRDQALLFLPKLHERAIAMTTAEKFPPNPSKANCRWCSYKNGEEPPCKWGVK